MGTSYWDFKLSLPLSLSVYLGINFTQRFSSDTHSDTPVSNNKKLMENKMYDEQMKN